MLKVILLWSFTRAKMTLTFNPVGLGTVMEPLKGKASFLTKVEGTLWVRAMFLNDGLIDGVIVARGVLVGVGCTLGISLTGGGEYVIGLGDVMI